MAGGGIDSGIGNPPRSKATHVLQWGRVNMVGLYCQVPVGGSGVFHLWRVQKRNRSYMAEKLPIRR